MNPVDSELLMSRGFTLDALGLYEQAIACYDKALAIDGTNEDALFSKALTYERMDRFEDATRIFQFVIDGNPTHKEAGMN